MSIQVLCPFFIRIIGRFCGSSLYVRDISPPVSMWFAYIFSCSEFAFSLLFPLLHRSFKFDVVPFLYF